MEEQRPKTTIGDIPIWCHHHCSKIQIVFRDFLNDMLILQGSAAELIIKRERTKWLVKWVVIHGLDIRTVGQVFFENQDLLCAFGLSQIIPRFGEWIIDQYGGTTASQGKYIRYKDYLNIPCPGTGHDGDPNISIELDDKIKKAVAELVYGFVA